MLDVGGAIDNGCDVVAVLAEVGLLELVVREVLWEDRGSDLVDHQRVRHLHEHVLVLEQVLAQFVGHLGLVEACDDVCQAVLVG